MLYYLLNKAIRLIHNARKNYFSTTTKTIQLNSDSGYAYTKLAILYADSAVFFSKNDANSIEGIAAIEQAKKAQQIAIQKFKQIKHPNNTTIIHSLTGEAMYALGNALTDAYDASLYFSTKEEIEELIAKKRNLTRLEADEYSYETVQDFYYQKLEGINYELDLFQEKFEEASMNELPEIERTISQLQFDKADLLVKIQNSDNKLVKVRNDLSNEILMLVNEDLFSTDKKGFYSDAVPIPTQNIMPKGLVYRVQVGFFSGQLLPEHFDGIFPLSSEKNDILLQVCCWKLP